MTKRDRVEVSLRLSLARLPRILALALAFGACAVLAAPAAQAAIEGGSGSGQGRPSPAATAFTVAFPQPRGAEVAVQPNAAAGPMLPMEARPDNASTGFFLGGSVTANWGASGIRMQVGSVQNQSGNTSGNLRLELWATTTAPVFGNAITFFRLGPNHDLGTLQSGFQFTNVDTGLVGPYTPPPNGCYFVTVALTEFNGSQYVYVDLVTFTSGGVADPGGSGFDLFGFGVSNGSCAGSTGSCTRTATTACLDGGRFQVRVSYVNSQSSGNGTVMSFNGTRAESDESAFLYFTDPSNFEMGLKILNACGFSSHFWVFIGGLTNQGWTVSIVDTSNGNSFSYHNANGHLTSTTADTNGGPPCP
ncbi:MAG TPA: hypothetical protein VHG32_22730 [Thermoanaerobaculia bacterium]|jgi:hypothetical protein|nr:hypothetical protein [Thermoanaerobaculia bacterium]